jgi:arsenate reductase
MKRRVLFICNQNSGRSQMAEALMRAFCGDAYTAYSAGFNPSSAINPRIKEVIEELGIDMSHHRPKHVSEFHDMNMDFVVLMCTCEESCAPLPRSDVIMHAEFPDPSTFTGGPEEVRVQIRKVRDSIREWIDAAFGENSPLQE